MRKAHFQTAKIRAAEGTFSRGNHINWPAVEELVSRVCYEFDIPRPELAKGELEVRRGRITLPARCRSLTALHALAHLLTDPIFPPHGAEFVAVWVQLVEQYDGMARADRLAATLDRLKVHRDADTRRRMAVGGARYRWNHKPGQDVELVLDDPPERVRGALEGCEPLVVGGRRFAADRARYLYAPEEAA